MLWEDEHNKGAVVLSKAINDFKGFYVKVGLRFAGPIVQQNAGKLIELAVHPWGYGADRVGC